jgi:ATP-dependent Clp protease ATP-binding subunit ClpA
MGLLRRFFHMLADTRVMPGFEQHPKLGRLLATAQREARLMNHHAVDIEHVVLALVAARVFPAGPSLPEARDLVARLLPHSNTPPQETMLPRSVTVHRVLDVTRRLARERTSEAMTPLLLALALLEDGDPAVLKLLEKLHIDIARLREVAQSTTPAAVSPESDEENEG